MRKMLATMTLIFAAGLALAQNDVGTPQSEQVNITDQMNQMREISATKAQAEQDIKNAEWQHHMEFLRYLDMHDDK